ncbi:MAG: amidohydrolase [Bacteroidetes bacterium]|nr:amidohydrolase [Bacteroidota bacterium]MBM3424526.1 amidohydrolase [Bacteroidota bacterium]
MKILYIFLVTLTLNSCMKRKYADLIIHNAVIHTLDEKNSVGAAMAIAEGKVLEVGPERQILNKYRYGASIDAEKKHIYPGFTDAHTHLFSLANQNLGVDLTGCQSMDEVVERVRIYIKIHKGHFVVGRGWDQTQWEVDQMPNNNRISEAFPDIPVALYRIDGHALLVNQALLRQVKKMGSLINEGLKTGLFVDNAMQIPESCMEDYTDAAYYEELLKIQQELLHYGIIGVHEAGISSRQFRILQRLDASNKWKISIYAMLMANSENYALAAKIKHYSQGNLSVRSFKLLLDGALGSRGALLKGAYSDRPNYKGLLLVGLKDLEIWVDRSLALDYQLNVHAIGDSANKSALLAFRRAYGTKPDHRWRIEHAQMVDPIDLHWFRDYAVFPSVQPTHATSDYPWAASRIGKQRLAYAYTYRSLLEQFGMIAFGTDFPVESINPFLTLRSAVLRMNPGNLPKNGFQQQEAVSLEMALKAMTVWPQFASFSERKRGALSQGMEASFFIAQKPFSERNIPADNYAHMTFIRGKKVYDASE